MTQPVDDGTSQMFGPPPSESVFWDQPDPNAPAPQERRSDDQTLEIDLGDGNKITIPKEALDELKKSEAFQEQAASMAAMVAAEAMKLSHVPGAVFSPVLKDGVWTVRPGNTEAERAEAEHGSLTVAMTSIQTRLSARHGE